MILCTQLDQGRDHAHLKEHRAEGLECKDFSVFRSEIMIHGKGHGLYHSLAIFRYSHQTCGSLNTSNVLKCTSS